MDAADERMPRLVIVSAAPLLADGVAAALRSEDWQVDVGRADDAADAWVLLGDDVIVRGAHGAHAQLSGGADAARLRAAVAAVVRETPWAIELGDGLGEATEREPLTPREIEVFELLGKGLSNRDIGGVLGISAHTAKYHVAQILAKVGAATRAEAVREGLRHGWIGL
jgi:DNA-binding CsgD family transcriptional regulator